MEIYHSTKMKILKTESGCPISRAKGGCFKRHGKLVFIKSQKEVEQGSETERSTILDEKIKTKSLFYIKSRGKVPVGRNRKTYHLTKSQDRELVLYQELKVV